MHDQSRVSIRNIPKPQLFSFFYPPKACTISSPLVMGNPNCARKLMLLLSVLMYRI